LDKQKIDEILDLLEMEIKIIDNLEIVKFKIECLNLFNENLDLLLECIKMIEKETDEDWDKWMRRHGMENNI
jgi:hypothetical protein